MFGKHKEKRERAGGGGVPLEEVRRMAGKGMSDRDIIKELKGRGYSYSEIERAMLAAVKEGVSEQPGFGAPSAEEFYPTPPSELQPSFEIPTFEEEVPELASPEQTETMMEELIEGVIEEKWTKFEDRIGKMEDSFEKIRAELKQWEIRQEQQRRESPTRELELRISELSEQLEDIDARVGGLEKAFKQFLPALTKNIESLSHLIHDLREKQGIVEEEV